MRLFVAVRPPPAAVGDLDRRVSGLRAPTGDLRWTPPEHWHVTLAFLGEVDERRYAELTPRLGRAAGRAHELPLSLTGAGTFPRRADRARVLWVGLSGDRIGLARLATVALAAARRSGLPVEDRRFSAHLTLARARPPAGTDLTTVVTALSAYAGPSWTATELELVRSHIGPTVRHELVDRWPLGTPGPSTGAVDSPRRSRKAR